MHGLRVSNSYICASLLPKLKFGGSLVLDGYSTELVIQNHLATLKETRFSMAVKTIIVAVLRP